MKCKYKVQWELTAKCFRLSFPEADSELRIVAPGKCSAEKPEIKWRKHKKGEETKQGHNFRRYLWPDAARESWSVNYTSEFVLSQGKRLSPCHTICPVWRTGYGARARAWWECKVQILPALRTSGLGSLRTVGQRRVTGVGYWRQNCVKAWRRADRDDKGDPSGIWVQHEHFQLVLHPAYCSDHLHLTFKSQLLPDGGHHNF